MDPDKRAPRVLVAASGSGGHLMPARYIIEALQSLHPDAKVEFVGSGRVLEGTIIDPTGITRHIIHTVGIKRRGIKGFLEFLLTTPKAVFRTVKLFRSLRPDVVIGVGGYVTFFPVTLAFLFRIPRWIHEAERKPGLATYVLSF